MNVRRPRRDFFLEHPEDSVSRAKRELGLELSPAVAGRFVAIMARRRLQDALGDDLFSRVVRVVRESPEARREVLLWLRGAWWRVRNQRVGVTRDSAVVGGLEALDCLEVLSAAGALDADLIQMIECLSSGCTCDGCDVACGERLRYLGGCGGE